MTSNFSHYTVACMLTVSNQCHDKIGPPHQFCETNLVLQCQVVMSEFVFTIAMWSIH